jgi:phage baseplate assembly protein gpV
MSDFTRYPSSLRDTQDYVERGVWGGSEDVPGAGQMMRVRGTGTEDLEVPILSFGYSFNLGGGDANAEVVMFSLGSDVNDKVALPCIPRDQAFQWPAGTGGVQHPQNPERRLEYNADETWLKDGNYKLGDNKEVEVVVNGGAVTINIRPDAEIVVPNLKVTGNLEVEGNFAATGGTFTHNGTNVGDTHTHGGVEVGPGSTGAPT